MCVGVSASTLCVHACGISTLCVCTCVCDSTLCVHALALACTCGLNVPVQIRDQHKLPSSSAPHLYILDKSLLLNLGLPYRLGCTTTELCSSTVPLVRAGCTPLGLDCHANAESSAWVAVTLPTEPALPKDRVSKTTHLSVGFPVSTSCCLCEDSGI